MNLEPKTSSPQAPYEGLTPDTVLDALDSVGLQGDGRLIQLNSYENRVFQVFLEDKSVVVAKFYRPARWTDEQILEEHSFAAELAMAEIPVVACLTLHHDPLARVAPSELIGDPPTLGRMDASLGAYRFAIAPRRSGRSPELSTAESLQWVGRFIGRMHAVGASKPFKHRIKLDVATTGEAARDWLLANQLVPAEVEADWKEACDQALVEAARLFALAGDTRQIRLHGDCHLGNVLWTDDGPHFVDLDDACTGPAMQDLWMLLSGERPEMLQQLTEILAGYEDFMAFDWREVHLIEALRTLRIIHHSAWLARRWDDPAFPAAFPWFGTAAYWTEQVTRLRDQVDLMAESSSDGLGVRLGADKDGESDEDLDARLRE
jgi:Ser/Thr protein kinase RdoA (MazF antagonist)